MDVFSAFPHAISQDWELGEVRRGTEVGSAYLPIGIIDVIVDAGDSVSLHQSPNADGISSDTMLFVRSEQMPTTFPGVLMASYIWLNIAEDQFYEIIDVGVARNQENGQIEHLELKLRQTEAKYVCNS